MSIVGLDEGSNWRFPKWLHIRDNSKAEANATTLLSTNGFADSTKTDRKPTSQVVDKGTLVSAS